MINYIDDEEKDLIESLHSENWVSDFNDDIKKMYEEYAKNSFQFDNKVEINLTGRDIQKIKIKAIQEGIPFNDLISMLVHKYNEGKIAITS